MNRNVRGMLCVLWGAVGIAAGMVTAVWYDRASARGEAPKLSGWGLLFLIGMAVAALFFFLAFVASQENLHATSVATAALTSAGVAIAITLAGPEIGWDATANLSIFVGVCLVWAIVMFILGCFRDRVNQ